MLLLAACNPSREVRLTVDNTDPISTENRVIYQMNIGAFTPEGTFQAAQEQLARLDTLGADILWLMPIYPRGVTKCSPYASMVFRQVNPAYGTIGDLKAFVEAAHRHGMKVWLDWVPNHVAVENPWVKTHPEYFTKDAKGRMIHPHGWNDVFELNYQDEGLVNEMNSTLKFWIDSCGFDYDYAWEFQGALAWKFRNSSNADTLRLICDKMLEASAQVKNRRMVYLTNHDQNYNDGGRTLTQMYGSNRYPLTVLAFTLYGMPLIYNGQETGGNQILDYFSDAKIRWSDRDSKMLGTLRTLTALRHECPALGNRVEFNWVTVTNNSSVLAYTRKAGESEVLVILNMAATDGNATLTGLTAGQWSLWLNSETIAQGTSRKQATLSTTQTFSLDAKGYRVYVRGTYPEEDLPPFEAYTPKLDSPDEISIFFETTSADAYSVWVWGNLGGGNAYCNNTSWPGDAMTLMGQTDKGSFVYKYVVTKVDEAPQYLIISKNGGNTKIYDGVAFVNHGYYVEGKTEPVQIITETAGITGVTTDQSADGIIYTLSGRQVASDQPLTRGFYIKDGRKLMVR